MFLQPMHNARFLEPCKMSCLRLVYSDVFLQITYNVMFLQFMYIVIFLWLWYNVLFLRSMCNVLFFATAHVWRDVLWDIMPREVSVSRVTARVNHARQSPQGKSSVLAVSLVTCSLKAKERARKSVKKDTIKVNIVNKPCKWQHFFFSTALINLFCNTIHVSVFNANFSL